jgi:hypothetical protein
MFDIKTIADYKDTINLKRLCEASGLNYSTFTKKIYRYLKNPENGQISPNESKKIKNGLKVLKIQLLP